MPARLRTAGQPPRCGAARQAPWLARAGVAWARLAALAAVVGALAACAGPADQDAAAPWHTPEAAGGQGDHRLSLHRREAVAAANPLAAQAGAQMLAQGGSAVDAAIAAQAVLGLVEPQSSGLGGGALMLISDGTQVQAWDGRETAPAAADESQFLRPDGRAMPMSQAVPGGLSVGVPGVLRLLEAVHRAHGRLPWARLFEPAIAWADQGFAVSPRLHALLADTADEPAGLRSDPIARALYFRPDASGALQPLPVGSRLRNPAYAELLRRIARDGADAFYRGPAAEDLVRRVREDRRQPGRLSLADLAGYQPRLRAALCTERGDWRVCGFPPPSSGHLAVMQIIGLLAERQGQGAHPEPAWPRWPALAAEDALPDAAVESVHVYLEASRLAFADRAQYVADPDFVAPPAGDWASLLAPDYLRQRARSLSARAAGVVPPGQPAGAALVWAPADDQPEHGTSHLSIVDERGLAVAMTTTVEAGFGARLMSDGGTGLPGGFVLNNQLTDFNLQPRDTAGRWVANRVQPGKRPRSSMSPTLVFDRRSGQLRAVLGSAGGPTIIHSVATALLALSAGQDPQAAADAPHLANFNGASLLEAGRWPPTMAQALRARGHTVVETELTSGTQVLEARDGVWRGGADRRREGVVLGR